MLTCCGFTIFSALESFSVSLNWLSPPQALWNPTPYLVQNQRSSVEDDASWSHRGVGLPITCMRTAGL